MKNKLLFMGLFLLGTTLSSQTLNIADMELNNPTAKPDLRELITIWRSNTNPLEDNPPTANFVANPNPSGINQTANCIEYVNTLDAIKDNGLVLRFGGAFTATGGFRLRNLGNAPTVDRRHFKFMMYSTVGKTINLDVEVGNVSYRHAKPVTLLENEWTEVLFDFTNNNLTATINPDQFNSRIRIRIDTDIPGDGATYYFDEFTGNDTKYETVASGDYATATNWYPPNAPNQVVDFVTVKHNMTYTGDLSLRELTINGKRSLEIDGNLTTSRITNIFNAGALTVSGTSSGSLVNFFRVLEQPVVAGDEEGWRLISSPVAGEQYNDAWFTTYGVATSSTVSNRRGLGTYNNTTEEWSYEERTPVPDTNFAKGKGYILKLAPPNKAVQFRGTLRTSDVTDVALTKNTNGYNLLGNPFGGYMTVANLMAANDAGSNDLLTSSTIWVWNSNTKAYEAKIGSYLITPAQGFFVEASAAASTFTFNTSMLEALPLNETDNLSLLKSSTATSIELNISDGDLTRFAQVDYLDNGTKEFDNGFDAKLFGGVPQPFAIYTQLLENNVGNDYQIQALPNSDLQNTVVPVGINAIAGKEITITANVEGLPSDLKVFLEDRDNNTFTELGDSKEFKTTLSSELTGIGRFYLHTKANSVLSVDDVVLDNVSVYTTSKSNLRVVGLPQGKAKLKLYNILGKQVVNTSFTSKGVYNVNLPSLSSGIYIIQIETVKGKLNKKITLE